MIVSQPLVRARTCMRTVICSASWYIAPFVKKHIAVREAEAPRCTERVPLASFSWLWRNQLCLNSQPEFNTRSFARRDVKYIFLLPSTAVFLVRYRHAVQTPTKTHRLRPADETDTRNTYQVPKSVDFLSFPNRHILGRPWSMTRLSVIGRLDGTRWRTFLVGVELACGRRL